MSAKTKAAVIAAAKVGTVAVLAKALKDHVGAAYAAATDGDAAPTPILDACTTIAASYLNEVSAQDSPDIEASAGELADGQALYGTNLGTNDVAAAAGATQYNVVNDGDPCDFCQDIIDGGPYDMDDDTGFGQHHNGCQCTTEPISSEGSRMARTGTTNELRVQLTRAKVSTDSGKSILYGTPIVYNQRTVIHDGITPEGFGETISPHALHDAIRDGSFAPVLIVGHDTSSVPLASCRAGTMTFDNRSDGLHIRAELDPSSPNAQSVISSVQRGDLDGMSFVLGVDKGGDKWNADFSERYVDRISRCPELTLTAFPAYSQTSTSMSDRATNSGDARIDAILRAADDDVRAGKTHSAATVAKLKLIKKANAAVTKHVNALLSKPNGNSAPTAGGLNDGTQGGSGPGASGQGFTDAGDNTGTRGGHCTLSMLDEDLKELARSTARLHSIVIESIRAEHGIAKPRHSHVDKRVRLLIQNDLEELRQEQEIKRIRQEAGL